MVKKKKRRNKTKTKIVNNIQLLLFSKVYIEYDIKKDLFLTEIHCSINNTLLKIKGYLDYDLLAHDNISVITPLTMLTYQHKQKFNVNKLGFAKKDAPNLLDIIKNYVNSVGDQLDANQPLPKPLIIQNNGFGIEDKHLPSHINQFPDILDLGLTQGILNILFDNNLDKTYKIIQAIKKNKLQEFPGIGPKTEEKLKNLLKQYI